MPMIGTSAMEDRRDAAVVGCDEAAGRSADRTGNGCAEHNFHLNWRSAAISAVATRQAMKPCGENCVNSRVKRQSAAQRGRHRQSPRNGQRSCFVKSNKID